MSTSPARTTDPEVDGAVSLLRAQGWTLQSPVTPTDEPDRCLTCHWWGLRDSASIPEANRQCHRFPPVATRDAEGEMMSEWPWTNQHDYCGEHWNRFAAVARHPVSESDQSATTARAKARRALKPLFDRPVSPAQILACDAVTFEIERLERENDGLRSQLAPHE